MLNFASQTITYGKLRNIAYITAILAATSGAAGAKEQKSDQQPANAREYYSFVDQPSGGPAVSRWDRTRFDRSGTRGREGLGADPVHPEGPGNVSN
jgi:hypothetical protein